MAILRQLNRSGIQTRTELVQVGAACGPVNQVVKFGLVLNSLDGRCNLERDGSKACRKEPQDVLVPTLGQQFLQYR